MSYGAPPPPDSVPAAEVLTHAAYEQRYKVEPLAALIPDSAVAIYKDMVAAAGYDVVTGAYTAPAAETAGAAKVTAPAMTKADEAGSTTATEGSNNNTNNDDLAASKKAIASYYLDRSRDVIRQWRTLNTVDLNKTMPSSVADLYAGGVSAPMRQLFEMTLAESEGVVYQKQQQEEEPLLLLQKAANANTAGSAAVVEATAAKDPRYKNLSFESVSAAKAYSSATAKALSAHKKLDAEVAKRKLPEAISTATDPFYFDGPIAFAPQYDLVAPSSCNDDGDDTTTAASPAVVVVRPAADGAVLYNVDFVHESAHSLKQTIDGYIRDKNASSFSLEGENTENNKKKSMAFTSQWLTLENQLLSLESLYNYPTPLFKVPPPMKTTAADSKEEADADDVDDFFSNFKLPDGTPPLTTQIHADVEVAKLLFQRSAMGVDTVFALGMMPDQSHVFETTRRKLVRGYAEAMDFLQRKGRQNKKKSSSSSSSSGNGAANGEDDDAPVQMADLSPSLADIVRQSSILATCGPSVTNAMYHQKNNCNNDDDYDEKEENGDNNNNARDNNNNNLLSYDALVATVQQYVDAFQPFCFLEARYDLRDKLPKTVAVQEIGSDVERKKKKKKKENCNECDVANEEEEDEVAEEEEDFSDLFNDAKFLSQNDIVIYERFYRMFVAASCCGEAVLEFTTSTDMCVSLLDWLMLRNFRYSEFIKSNAYSLLQREKENNSNNRDDTCTTASSAVVEKQSAILPPSSSSSSSSIHQLAAAYTERLISSNTIPFTEARKDKYLMQRALEMANETRKSLNRKKSNNKSDKISSTNDNHNANDNDDENDNAAIDGESVPTLPPLTSAKSDRVGSFEEAVSVLLTEKWQQSSSTGSAPTAADSSDSSKMVIPAIPMKEVTIPSAASANKKTTTTSATITRPVIDIAALPTRCFPIVAKPVNGAGSEFVSLCYSWQELKNAFIVGRGSQTILGRDASVMCLQEYLGGGAKTRSITYDPITGKTLMKDDNYLPHLYTREPDYFKRSQEYVVDTVSYHGHHVFTDIWLSRKFPMKVKSTRMKATESTKMEKRHEEHKKKKEKEEKKEGDEESDNPTKKDDEHSDDAKTNKSKSAPPTAGDDATEEPADAAEDSEVLALHDSDEAYDAKGKRKAVMTTTFVYDYQDLVLPLNVEMTKGVRSYVHGGDVKTKKMVNSDEGEEGEGEGEERVRLTHLAQTDINTKIIIDYSIRVLNAMGVANGPAHCEVMLTFPDQTEAQKAAGVYPTPIPKLIELNARPQGDMPRATPVMGTDQFIMTTHLYAFRGALGAAAAALRGGGGRGATDDDSKNKSASSSSSYSSLSAMWPPVGFPSRYGFDDVPESQPMVIAPQFVPPFSAPPYVPLMLPNELEARRRMQQQQIATTAATTQGEGGGGGGGEAEAAVVCAPSSNGSLGSGNNFGVNTNSNNQLSPISWASSQRALRRGVSNEKQLAVIRQRQTTASGSPFMLLSFDEHQYYAQYAPFYANVNANSNGKNQGDYAEKNANNNATTTAANPLPDRLGCYRHGVVYDPTRAMLWARQGFDALFGGTSSGGSSSAALTPTSSSPSSSPSSAASVQLAAIVNDVLKGAIAPRPNDLMRLSMDSVGDALQDGVYAPWRAGGPPLPRDHQFNSTSNSNRATNNAEEEDEDDYTMRIVFMYCSDDVIFNEYGRRFIRDQLPCFVRFTRGVSVQRGPEKSFLNNSDKTIDIFSCPAAIILYGPRTVVERSHDMLRSLEDGAPSTLMSLWAMPQSLKPNDGGVVDDKNNKTLTATTTTANILSSALNFQNFVGTFVTDGPMRLLIADDWRKRIEVGNACAVTLGQISEKRRSIREAILANNGIDNLDDIIASGGADDDDNGDKEALLNSINEIVETAIRTDAATIMPPSLLRKILYFANLPFNYGDKKNFAKMVANENDDSAEENKEKGDNDGVPSFTPTDLKTMANRSNYFSSLLNDTIISAAYDDLLWQHDDDDDNAVVGDDDGDLSSSSFSSSPEETLSRLYTSLEKAFRRTLRKSGVVVDASSAPLSTLPPLSAVMAGSGGATSAATNSTMVNIIEKNDDDDEEEEEDDSRRANLEKIWDSAGCCVGNYFYLATSGQQQHVKEEQKKLRTAAALSAFILTKTVLPQILPTLFIVLRQRARFQSLTNTLRESEKLLVEQAMGTVVLDGLVAKGVTQLESATTNVKELVIDTTRKILKKRPSAAAGAAAEDEFAKANDDEAAEDGETKKDSERSDDDDDDAKKSTEDSDVMPLISKAFDWLLLTPESPEMTAAKQKANNKKILTNAEAASSVAVVNSALPTATSTITNHSLPIDSASVEAYHKAVGVTKISLTFDEDHIAAVAPLLDTMIVRSTRTVSKRVPTLVPFLTNALGGTKRIIVATAPTQLREGEDVNGVVAGNDDNANADNDDNTTASSSVVFTKDTKYATLELILRPALADNDADTGGKGNSLPLHPALRSAQFMLHGGGGGGDADMLAALLGTASASASASTTTTQVKAMDIFNHSRMLVEQSFGAFGGIGANSMEEIRVEEEEGAATSSSSSEEDDADEEEDNAEGTTATQLHGSVSPAPAATTATEDNGITSASTNDEDDATNNDDATPLHAGNEAVKSPPTAALSSPSSPPQSPSASTSSQSSSRWGSALIGGFVGALRTVTSRAASGFRASVTGGGSVSTPPPEADAADCPDAFASPTTSRAAAPQNNDLAKTPEAESTVLVNASTSQLPMKKKTINKKKNKRPKQKKEKVLKCRTTVNFFSTNAFKDETEAFVIIFESLGITVNRHGGGDNGTSSSSSPSSSSNPIRERLLCSSTYLLSSNANNNNSSGGGDSNVSSSTVFVDRLRFINDTLNTILMVSRNVVSESIQCPLDLHGMRERFVDVGKNLATMAAANIDAYGDDDNDNNCRRRRAKVLAAGGDGDCEDAAVGRHSDTAEQKALLMKKCFGSSVIYPAAHEAAVKYLHAVKMDDLPRNLIIAYDNIVVISQQAANYIDLLTTVTAEAATLLAMRNAHAAAQNKKKENKVCETSDACAVAASSTSSSLESEDCEVDIRFKELYVGEQLATLLAQRTALENNVTRIIATTIGPVAKRSSDFIGYLANIARNTSYSAKRNLLSEPLGQTEESCKKWAAFCGGFEGRTTTTHRRNDDDDPTTISSPSPSSSSVVAVIRGHSRAIEAKSFTKRFDQSFGKLFGISSSSSSSCQHAKGSEKERAFTDELDELNDDDEGSCDSDDDDDSIDINYDGSEVMPNETQSAVFAAKSVLSKGLQSLHTIDTKALKACQLLNVFNRQRQWWREECQKRALYNSSKIKSNNNADTTASHLYRNFTSAPSDNNNDLFDEAALEWQAKITMGVSLSVNKFLPIDAFYQNVIDHAVNNDLIVAAAKSMQKEAQQRRSAFERQQLEQFMAKKMAKQLAKKKAAVEKKNKRRSSDEDDDDDANADDDEHSSSNEDEEDNSDLDFSDSDHDDFFIPPATASSSPTTTNMTTFHERPQRDSEHTAPYNVVDDLAVIINHSASVAAPPTYIRMPIFSALRDMGVVGSILLPDDHRTA